MIELNELQALLNKGIIKVKEKETTFFDIAGFPHYENVISNIYAFFFDPSKPHGLGSLFIDSLLKCIKTNYTFVSPRIYREFRTIKGGRIDLVIQDKDPDNRKVIIIENKMYHQVYNDLEDYYNSFEENIRIGILLTLNDAKPSHPGFIPVTHKKLLNEVFNQLGKYILMVPDQVLFILKEFSKNLNNLNMDHETGEYFDFYHSNLKKISAIEKLKEELKRHMWAQIDQGQELLSELNLSLSARNNEWFRYYLSSKTDKVFLTVLPSILNSEQPSVKIIVELNYAGIQKIKEVNGLEFTLEEQRYLRETSPIRKNYLHYAFFDFNVTKNDFENLGKFIKDKISSTPLQTIFIKIENHFSTKI